MDCTCGHHHAPAADTGGAEIPLTRPLVALHGRLICRDAAQMMLALDLLPEHARLSRAEPGCLRFEIAQDDDPLVWTLDEVFADKAAFAAHQDRARASEWGLRSTDLGRDFHRHALLPRLRPEAAGDTAGIDALLSAAFGGGDEAALVRALRAAGDLTHSLVAHAGGVPVGHVALSPLAAKRPALALAPLAVHPALQGRGIGTALVRAALEAAGDRPVVVLGEPAFYARFGFAPADLASPYAGAHLMIRGNLPAGSGIAHAPAFATL
ncbi:GNAT family N-acetyltransferase [Paracoccus tibetensis]|uniref:Putative acetyltransferase n=1 Tax=Paracoccus tibetensis TaxID=336292 RepID=A0A1G5FJ01_9RHOB|nr:GNAT family N-acetyltransferase [Paracoccus tibetensis]SCY38830.1 putative acetyltransferase [Paracoccus tibetensis]